jgi:hypothetical protein
VTLGVFNTMEYFNKHRDNQPENNGPDLFESVCILDMLGVKSEIVSDAVLDIFEMKILENL